MARRNLTTKFLADVRPPAQGQAEYFHKGYPGLALRVSYGGRRTFVAFLRVGRVLRRITLGNYPETTLEEAIEAWRIARKEAAAGRDPSRVRKAHLPVLGYDEVLEQWFTRDQSENRSVGKTRRLMAANVPWSGRNVTEITKRDVLDVLDAIVDRGTRGTADSVQSALHRFFKWSVGRGIIQVNPAASLDRVGTPKERDRTLSDQELVKVWRAAEAKGVPYGRAVQLLALTGARREEFGQLRWDEIDSNTIKLSGSRTKNGEPHDLALATPAMSLLESMPRIEGCPFVFSVDGKHPISGWSRAKAEIDALAQIEPWRIHDLRRSVATGMQRLGVGLQVVETILGHISGSRSGVVGIYQRHKYTDEARAALEVWSNHVLSIVEGRPANVVPIRA